MKLVWHKIRNKVKFDIIPIAKIYLEFPQIKAFFCILIMALFSFIAAYMIENAFWSSICANISAGLITGIVLFLLSGCRQIYIARQELRYQWLKQLHEIILKFIEQKRKMMFEYPAINCIEFEEAIYDTICAAHDVNVYINSSQRDSKLGFDTIKYCKKQYNYNSKQNEDRDDTVRDKVRLGEYTSKQEADRLFDEIFHDLFDLNHKVVNDMTDIEVKLKVINRSII